MRELIPGVRICITQSSKSYRDQWPLWEPSLPKKINKSLNTVATFLHPSLATMYSGGPQKTIRFEGSLTNTMPEKERGEGVYICV